MYHFPWTEVLYFDSPKTYSIFFCRTYVIFLFKWTRREGDTELTCYNCEIGSNLILLLIIAGILFLSFIVKKKHFKKCSWQMLDLTSKCCIVSMQINQYHALHLSVALLIVNVVHISFDWSQKLSGFIGLRERCTAIFL